MSIAHFIVVDNKDPGFDTFFNGKAIARARASLDVITKKLGLKGIDDLTSFGELEDEFEVPEEYRETETSWFEAEEGLAWVDAIRGHIEANPKSVKQPDRVLADLDEYAQVLQQAARIGARWHFQMDV